MQRATNVTFQKEDTNIAKGCAILFMLFHHLFAFPNRTALPYISILPRQLLEIVARFGSLCVAIFVLLTGFGIYQIQKNTHLPIFFKRQIKRFLLQYLLVFVLCIPPGFILFGIRFNIAEFFSNLLLLQISYNKEWWFIRLYLELLLISPFLFVWIRKHAITGMLLSFFLGIIGLILPGDSNAFWDEITKILTWQVVLCEGYFLGKTNWLNRFYSYMCSKKRWLCYGFFPIVILCIYLRQQTTFPTKLKDPLLAPIIIIISTAYIKQRKLSCIFSYLGKHSMNMWLVHTFFCYYYLKKLIFAPYFAPAIFVWLILHSLLASIAIEFIKTIIQKGFCKCNLQKKIP